MKTPGVVAFAFGAPSSIKSNQEIALITSQRAKELEAPVFTQSDIVVEPGIEVEFTQEAQDNPPPTLRIAREAVDWARKNEFEELLVVCARPHLWRVLRDMSQAVYEAESHIKVKACLEIFKHPEDWWFCPESTQPRVRSKKDWQKRERILKLMPFFIYKRVAS